MPDASAFLGATRQAPCTYKHPLPHRSCLPPFIFLSNNHRSPDKQPEKHSPCLSGGQALPLINPSARTTTTTTASALQPRAACSNPAPLGNRQIPFHPVKLCAENWPHPSTLAPSTDPNKGPGLPASPACRSQPCSAFQHTYGLSRNSPALARCLIHNHKSHFRCKRPLTLSSPTVNLILPRPPLIHVPKRHAYVSFKHLPQW